ncbi:MAG: Type 1 glutamine amidotransferase-like domain-containing protein [Patescibacteria group bacterium]
MTKYVINSGGLRKNPEKNKLYVAEILKDLGKKPKVLICFFAQKREDWESDYKDYVDNIQKILPDNLSPSFDLAFPEKFIKQMGVSDALIIPGGDDHLIQYWLKQFDLKKIWQNKTVAISSASSDALVKHFWTCDWRQNMDGLGILPFKFIPHYKSNWGADDPRGPIDWDKAYSTLENYGDKNLPIYALEEGEFIVIKQ